MHTHNYVRPPSIYFKYLSFSLVFFNFLKHLLRIVYDIYVWVYIFEDSNMLLPILTTKLVMFGKNYITVRKFSTQIMVAYPPISHRIMVHKFLRPAYPRGGDRICSFSGSYCPNGINKLRLCTIGVCGLRNTKDN